MISYEFLQVIIGITALANGAIAVFIGYMLSMIRGINEKIGKLCELNGVLTERTEYIEKIIDKHDDEIQRLWDTLYGMYPALKNQRRS